MSEPIFADGDPIAPPRRNGELVFDAPWESRVFGVAAALRERGLFTWDEFRICLIAEIAAWERQHEPGEVWSYYARWQAALERLLVQKRVYSASELDARERALASRPAGHDHRDDRHQREDST